MPEPFAARATEKLGDLAAEAGIRRVHLLAWRDLDDVEAGGSEVHAAWVARLWSQAGLEVTMRTSHAQGQLHEGERDGYRVVRRGGRQSVFPYAALQEAFGRLGPYDALVEVWNGVPFFTPLWARVPRVTVVHHVHADMWRQALTSRLAAIGEAVELQIAPRLYRRTPIVTPSPSSRDEIVRRLRLPARNVRVVPNGIDPQFHPLGEKSPRPLLVAVGRIVPHKRMPDLVDAVAAVQPDFPDLELVIVGDGYDREHLRHHVDARGVEGWVHITGRVSDDELVRLYQQSWATVTASSAEGWGMTITEAAACGTPAIATRIAGHVDTVTDGVTGLLADDPPGLTPLLRRFLADAGLRDRLAQGALARAAALTWDRTALGIMEVLAEQAARRRR
jgi:glycosyltransferase involved in cell wall biosynthesis